MLLIINSSRRKTLFEVAIQKVVYPFRLLFWSSTLKTSKKPAWLLAVVCPGSKKTFSLKPSANQQGR